MIGVVLWSNSSSQQAVIWCEDQGDLAFLDVAEGMAEGAEVVTTGDLISFELQGDAPVRRVRNACTLASDHYPALAKVLKNAAAGLLAPQAEEAPDKKGEVVAFRSPTSPRYSVHASAQRAASLG